MAQMFWCGARGFAVCGTVMSWSWCDRSRGCRSGRWQGSRSGNEFLRKTLDNNPHRFVNMAKFRTVGAVRSIRVCAALCAVPAQVSKQSQSASTRTPHLRAPPIPTSSCATRFFEFWGLALIHVIFLLHGHKFTELVEVVARLIPAKLWCIGRYLTISASLPIVHIPFCTA
jgi:hypothetical protein